MLKKAGNITIILLLLIATGGMPITRHYCGTVVKSYAIFTTPKACCNDHCDKCHNVFKFTKVNDDFEAGSSLSIHTITDNIILHSTLFIDLFNSSAIFPNPDFAYQRAGFNLKAGHSPASLGNFRC